MRGGEAINPPILPINETITPDKWLNIPACLMKAFEDDIKNQQYLERFANNLSFRANKLDTKISDQRRQIENVIEERAQDLKRELGKSLTGSEVKLK